jgi:hypothetical protein
MKNTLLLNEAEVSYLENLSHLNKDEFFVISRDLIKEGKRSKAFYLELSDLILKKTIDSYKVCLIFNLAILLNMFKEDIKNNSIYEDIVKASNLEPGNEI